MAPLPDILSRPVVFWGRESGHRWSADRIRLKLTTGPADFAAEAERQAEIAFGPEAQCRGGDEEVLVDQQMRAQFVDDYQRMEERTESYLWGLGIAGIYHQFERDIREVIQAFLKPKLTTPKADFTKLCGYLEGIGYEIKQSVWFDELNTARLIANAIKHGEGTGFDALANKRPDLFPEYQKYALDMKRSMQPNVEDIRIGFVEFDMAVSAISMIWPEMEGAISPVAERT